MKKIVKRIIRLSKLEPLKFVIFITLKIQKRRHKRIEIMLDEKVP